MSGWIIVNDSSYYGPFPTMAKAVAWGEKRLGSYKYTGRGWTVAELWNPKNVDG